MKRLLRVVLVVVTPILVAAVCMVGSPPTPEATRVVIKGVLGGIDMAEDILIVTPFATFTPTLTMTPTPTLTPTVEGGGGQGGGTSGGDGGGNGNPDQNQPGGPGVAGSPTSIALVTLTASPSPIATTTPSATASPSATVSPSATASPSASPTPSPTATLMPALTPTVPPSSGGGGGGGGGGAPAPPTDTPIPPLPVISFSSTVYNIGEGGVSAIITVVLDTASSVTVSVNFSTSNGSAFAPNDYSPANGALSFPPGTTSQTFSVPITQDIVDDPDIETVRLSLSSPVNGTLGTSTATLQIADDDPLPVLQFTVPITVNIVFENIPPPSFDVVLDRPTGKGISFTYQPENPNSGTATSGIDYVDTFNVDTFAPDITGVSPTTLTITWSGILDDVIPEGPETLIMEIGSNPAAYTLGPNFQTSLTILSDE